MRNSRSKSAGSWWRLLWGASSLLAASTGAADTLHRLSAEDMRLAFSDHTLRDEAHWTYRFLADGNLDAVDMGQHLRGIWRISNKELCIDLTVHRKVETDCYQVWRSAELIELRRDGLMILQGKLTD